MNYADLKIGKLVQTVLRPLLISKATQSEVMQMQGLEYSKENFGIQYPLLLKTSSSVAEKHYYSELFTLYGETYRLCCEWFETATNNDRPYVEKWIREHEKVVEEDFFKMDNEPKKKVGISPKDGIAIGDGQYKGREDLTVVEIPDGVKYIGRDAFAFCSNLKEIIIPDSVACIDEAAFWCCSNLENVQLPEGLRYLGASAFGNCASLQKINIPSQITVIPLGCFYKCTRLKEVKFYANVRVIMDSAFYDCVSLSSFSLYGNERLSAIFNNAFRGCKNFVFETIDRNVIIGDCDNSALAAGDIMIDKEAFDWGQLTIRTFKGAPGAKFAQKFGLNVEYVKDER